jgi:hypothetical protein
VVAIQPTCIHQLLFVKFLRPISLIYLFLNQLDPVLSPLTPLALEVLLVFARRLVLVEMQLWKLTEVIVLRLVDIIESHVVRVKPLVLHV